MFRETFAIFQAFFRNGLSVRSGIPLYSDKYVASFVSYDKTVEDAKLTVGEASNTWDEYAYTNVVQCELLNICVHTPLSNYPHAPPKSAEFPEFACGPARGSNLRCGAAFAL